MFLVLLFTVSNTQSYKSSYKKSGKGKYHAENHMNKNNVDYSNYSFRQDESNSIVTFNKKRVSTKVLRSGVSDKLSCDLNKCENIVKVVWSFRSRKTRKRLRIGKIHFNGNNTRYFSTYPNITVEWENGSGFSKLYLPNVNKDMEGSYYCAVKTIKRDNFCPRLQKTVIKIKGIQKNLRL